MSKKAIHLNQHKIAALLSLLLDYADEYPNVVEVCESVINDLYDNIEELRKEPYFENLTKKIEERVTTDLLMIGLLTITSLTEAKANSKRAYSLMRELEKMCNSLPQNYSVVDLKNHEEKLKTVIRKNFKNIQKKTV